MKTPETMNMLKSVELSPPLVISGSALPVTEHGIFLVPRSMSYRQDIEAGYGGQGTGSHAAGK